MDVVLDSSSLNHLLRSPRKRRGGGQEEFECSIDPFINSGKLRLALDPARALVDEWRQTCDSEAVQVLITQWEANNGIFVVDAAGKISPADTKTLKSLGFNDTCDKLVVRIALVTDDRIIVSEDSDFWDPKTKANRGNKNAPVARLLREAMEITVLGLAILIRKLDQG